MQKAHFQYPPSRTEDVIDDYHGTPIADPYRWLEDPTTEEAQAWIAAQNTLTANYLAEISARASIHERLTHLYDMARQGAPARHGKYYVYSKNSGLQNQDVLYLREGLEGEERLLLDPNTLSDTGTVALMMTSFNEAGTLMAYSTATDGSDWQEIRVLNVETGEQYDDLLEWCKFAGMAWKDDSSGFYYSRFPVQDSKHSQEAPYNNKVYLHAIGTPQSEDKLIYERPDHKEMGFYPFFTDDHAYLILYVFEGAVNRNRIYYRPADSDGDFIRLLDEGDAEYAMICNRGPVFYFKTNLDAPNGRVIAIDTDHPDRGNWRTVVPESDNPMDNVMIGNGELIIAYLQNAQHQIHRYSLDGEKLGTIPLPDMGTMININSKDEDSEAFIQFQSFLYPPTVLRYDFEHDAVETWFTPSINFPRDDYTTTQVWYPSKDGTQVSMFLVHRKDITLDGNNPTLLYGYGGFSISLTPGFGQYILTWLALGGVYAVANLRGGSEYGEAWHEGGMLENKQNVFDDFIAAAEYLISENYTQTSKLAIMGRSNGGLLVAACTVQRPDLFGAVVCVVPVTDMLRFHKFTAGRYWTAEYGNAEDDAAHFAFMHAYSPLHNVKAGTTYPPMLLTTAERDDRVVPLHAMKMTAAMQAADSGDHPILLRLDTKSGHGLGKPISKWIDEWADVFAFLHRTLQM